MNIEKGIQYCSDHKVFDKLYELYNNVPSGKCSGCTKCCHESVNISIVEGLNIIKQYYQTDTGNIEISNNLIKKLLKHHLAEWTKPEKCPFLDQEGRCEIYEARPLPCRIFGNRSMAAYQKNLSEVRKQNLNAARHIWNEMHLKVPKNVINRTIDYCENYQRNKVLSFDEVSEFYDKLINLDGTLYFEGIIDEMIFNQHLVGFFIENLVLEKDFNFVDLELLYDIKIEILKQINLNRE